MTYEEMLSFVNSLIPSGGPQSPPAMSPPLEAYPKGDRLSFAAEVPNYPGLPPSQANPTRPPVIPPAPTIPGAAPATRPPLPLGPADLSDLPGTPSPTEEKTGMRLRFGGPFALGESEPGRRLPMPEPAPPLVAPTRPPPRPEGPGLFTPRGPSPVQTVMDFFKGKEGAPTTGDYEAAARAAAGNMSRPSQFDVGGAGVPYPPAGQIIWGLPGGIPVAAPAAPPSPRYREDQQPQTPLPDQGIGTLGGVGATVPGAGPQGPAGARGPNDILAMLRGVQVPRPPEAQRVTTPHIPAGRGALGGGDLLALVNALQAQRRAASAGLPVTLGQAIR